MLAFLRVGNGGKNRQAYMNHCLSRNLDFIVTGTTLLKMN